MMETSNCCLPSAHRISAHMFRGSPHRCHCVVSLHAVHYWLLARQQTDMVSEKLYVMEHLASRVRYFLEVLVETTNIAKGQGASVKSTCRVMLCQCCVDNLFLLQPNTSDVAGLSWLFVFHNSIGRKIDRI